MIPLVGGALNVYRPQLPRPVDPEPDLVVPIERVASLEYSERIGHRKDNGTLTLINDDGEYTGIDLETETDPQSEEEAEADPITDAPRAQTAVRSGDRLELVIETGGDILTPWADPDGTDDWGDKTWAGNRFQWSAMVRDVGVTTHSPTYIDLSIDAEDFVFSLLGERLVYDAFRDRSVAGILEALFSANVRDIEWYISDDGELGKEIDATFDGTPLFDAVGEMLREGDAVARGYRDLLTVTPFEAPRRRFTMKDRDFTTIDMTERDDELANVVRVDGARALAIDPFSTEDVYGKSSLLTENRRHYARLNTRKSEVGAVDIWIRRNQGSTDDVTVRLQPDDGTGDAPIAEDDYGSDLAQKTLPFHFLAKGTWTRFLMPGHTLTETQPWVIIETGGTDGHYIGRTPTGTVMHRALYPFDIAVSDRDSESVATFRRRDARLKAEAADANEARLRAARHLQHHAGPAKEATIGADSSRMHMLRPGDVIAINQPRSAIVGEYIVTERTDNFATGANKIALDTTLTVRDVRTV